MSAEVIHREMVGLRWLAIALGLGCGGVITLAIATNYPWRGGLVLLAAIGVHVAWVIWGIYRMNRIVLTGDRLVVGREAFTLSDIDIFFGVQPSLVLQPDETDRVEEAWPLPPNSEIRIAGGSWGRRIGTTMLVLREAHSGRTVAVFTRHPDLLSQRLEAWLTAIPDTPASLVDPDHQVDG